VLGLAGFLLLAVGGNITFYLAAYALFLGPAMAISVVVPATLITRWFTFNAGKALGIVTVQLFIVFMPLATNWLVHAHGLPATYMALAALSAVGVIANFFVIDYPPGSAAAPRQMTGEAQASGGMTMRELITQPALWLVAFPYIACSAATVILVAHMVPLARSWGFPTAHAVIMLSAQSVGGLAGTIIFGWVADRLGGARTLVILTIDAVVLWALLLWHPSFPAAVAIIAVWGAHSSGTIPVISLTLSQTFGKAGFSRAYGLVQLMNLPFSVLCVPAASFAFAHTGSYASAIIGVIVFLAITCLLPLAAIRHRAPLLAS
jgi:predicted MFS family arabinose efflux permease